MPVIFTTKGFGGGGGNQWNFTLTYFSMFENFQE